MCSILGIFNFNGLSESDLAHFKKMFLRSEIRGKDASGVANQTLNFHKWSKRTGLSKKTEEFNAFLSQSVGLKWVIGHARAATQGTPSDNFNNHPLSADKSRFLLIHNGVVGSKKIVPREKRTDTYIIADAIQKNWIEGDLFTSVKNSYGFFYGAAAICVITPNDIVLARRWNPIVRGRLPNNTQLFASTEYILKGGRNDISKVHSLGDDFIIGYDGNGKSRNGRLQVVSRPFAFNSDWESSSRGFSSAASKPTSYDSYIPMSQRRFGYGGWWKDPKGHSKAAKLGHIRRKFRKR